MPRALTSGHRRSLVLGSILWAGSLVASLQAAESAKSPVMNRPVMVFAAISMSEALQDAGAAFTRRTGIVVKYSFASSAQLARQIEAGARADVFISADQKWMDELIRAQRIDIRTLRPLAENRLVVIRPAGRSSVDARDWMRSLDRGRLATGDPDYVPLGRYAREALTALGIWNVVQPRLARAENARVATLLVARGEAPLGIVYVTDAITEPRVEVVSSLDRSLHSRIVYPAALTREANATATAYLDFLSSDEGQKFFAKYGFEREAASSAQVRIP